MWCDYGLRGHNSHPHGAIVTAICLSQLKGWNFVSLSQSPTWTLTLNPTQPICGDKTNNSRNHNHIVWIALYCSSILVHITKKFQRWLWCISVMYPWIFLLVVGGIFLSKIAIVMWQLRYHMLLIKRPVKKLPSKQTPRNLFKSILSELRISWNSASLKIKAQISLCWTQNKGEIQLWKLPRPLKFCRLLNSILHLCCRNSYTCQMKGFHVRKYKRSVIVQIVFLNSFMLSSYF